MLEKMKEFFENRLYDYDRHMLQNIESAEEFYKFTAKMLPDKQNSSILDLGCGTGLELHSYYLICPSAKITAIDLSKKMLNILRQKFPDKDINLVEGSYFDLPFGENRFDAAVSVESLHHFNQNLKIDLYTKLNKALKNQGYFILTDYFSLSDEEEQTHQKNLIKLKAHQNIKDSEFYHYDTPLTVEHEKEALIKAGFSKVDVLNNWKQTYCIKAKK